MNRAPLFSRSPYRPARRPRFALAASPRLPIARATGARAGPRPDRSLAASPIITFAPKATGTGSAREANNEFRARSPSRARQRWARVRWGRLMRSFNDADASDLPAGAQKQDRKTRGIWASRSSARQGSTAGRTARCRARFCSIEVGPRRTGSPPTSRSRRRTPRKPPRRPTALAIARTPSTRWRIHAAASSSRIALDAWLQKCCR